MCNSARDFHLPLDGGGREGVERHRPMKGTLVKELERRREREQQQQ